jgi:hypothetical protein
VFKKHREALSYLTLPFQNGTMHLAFHEWGPRALFSAPDAGPSFLFGASDLRRLRLAALERQVLPNNIQPPDDI